MKFKSADLQTRLYITAAIILVLGLGSSIFIYLTAGDIDTETVFGDQIDESKSYRRSLELYGGKANLLASEFTQWFNGLWHGKSLGITIACITGFLCFVIFLVAFNLPSDSDSAHPDDKDQ
jgi:hypothetical protein